MKAVSVILTVYNVEDYILQCLKSIKAQTFQDFDVIIVDDCSKDNSTAIASAFLQRAAIGHTIVRNKENLGITESRKAGVEAATADHILFVDTDDWIEKTMLEELYEAAMTTDADIVTCNGLEIWEARETATRITTVGEGVYTSVAYLRHLFSWETTAYLWLRMFKRSLFTGVYFPKDMVYDDFLLFPYLLERANKIVQIDSALYNYIRRNNSLTLSKHRNIPSLIESMRSLDLHFKDIVAPAYTIRYNYLLLYFVLFNLFKFSDEFQDINIDLSSIRNYITVRNLFKIRVSTTSMIWFFLLLTKLNGRLGYSFFKGYFLIRKWWGLKAV